MKIWLAAAALAIALPGVATSAEPGRGFGDRGVRHGSYVQAILPLPNGEILFAASTEATGALCAYVWRTAADGTYLGGLPEARVSSGGGLCGSPHMVLDAQGRVLLAAGSTVERLLPSGSRDLTFGTAGRVVVAGLLSTALAVGVDGAVAVVGETRTQERVEPGQLLRLLPDGRLDPGFGSAGRVRLQTSEPTGVVVQADGKIIVADGRPARYDTRGDLDRSYVLDGSVTTGDILLSGLALQPDGKLLVVGYVSGGPVVRLLENGRLDPSFGSAGVAPRWPPVAGGGDIVERIAVQPEGGIVVQGESAYLKTILWFVHRLRADGSSAGPPRAVANSVDPSRDDGCWGEAAIALAVQPDGKVLASGNICHESRVVRLEPDLSDFDDDGSTISMARLRKGDVRLVRARDRWVASVQVTLDQKAWLVASVVRRRGGEPLRLLAGSAAGREVLRRPAELVSGEVGARRRVTVRVVVAAAAVKRGGTLLLRLDAEDDRTRRARLRIPLVAR